MGELRPARFGQADLEVSSPVLAASRTQLPGT